MKRSLKSVAKRAMNGYSHTNSPIDIPELYVQHLAAAILQDLRKECASMVDRNMPAAEGTDAWGYIACGSIQGAEALTNSMIRKYF